VLHKTKPGIMNKRRAAFIAAAVVLPAIFSPVSAQASTVGGGGGGCAVWVYNVHRISAASIGASAIYKCETVKLAINVDITAQRSGKTVWQVHQCGTGTSCTVSVVIPDIAGTQAYTFGGHGQFYLNQESLYTWPNPVYYF
jgi:hypothetical protein